MAVLDRWRGAPLPAEASTWQRPLPPDHARVARRALWPLAAIIMAYTVCVRSLNRGVTDDFTTVFLAVRRMWDGVPVYSENYAHVDPHYLYNPGATLILSPLGALTHLDAARAVFIIVNALAIAGAIVWILRMVGIRPGSPVVPAALGLAFLTESVVNTLGFSNINGILLLLMTVFLACLHGDRRLLGGIALGLAIVIKPLFAPLLFLPLMRGHLSTLAAGIGIPVLSNLLAWPVVPGAADYVRVVMPYLGETRDYANASLPGMALYLGMPSGWEIFWTLLFALLVALSVILLLRWRDTDPIMWSFTTSGVLLTGVFFLSSLGQMYYSMLLFPLLATVFLPRSVAHTWPFWVGVCLVLAPWSWSTDFSPTFSRWVPVFVATVGWGIIIAAIAAPLGAWWWQERRAQTATAGTRRRTA
nr:glycosyltransferase family 87 protein [Corynebacterium uropygiale]